MPTSKKKTTVKKEQSTEDMVLGKEPETIVVKHVKYESPERRYKVTNLALNNKPIIVDGTIIETFIGGKNVAARKELINGAKTVITKDAYKNTDLFKIEVVE